MRWLRWPGGPNLTGSGFESTRYLARWLLLGTTIGVVAGLGAIAFFLAIDWSTHLFLGQPHWRGCVGASPDGTTLATAAGRALGGLLSGLIVFTLAPEAEGHGTDAAIAAIHHRQGRVRARIPPIKLLASALVVPGALHMGYGWVQIGMSRGSLDLPLCMVVVLPFVKIVSTSLSIGSGGSGGIFGPGMVIGGMLGATFWRLTYGLLRACPTARRRS